MKKYTPYLILSVLNLLVYGNTLSNSFHYDDVPSILEKPWIRGLDKIPDFIFSFNHRPFLILTFNLNYAVSRFEVWSYHVFNILAHLGVVLLLYGFVRQALAYAREHSPDLADRFRSLPMVTALVFSLHPLNTQSVTYISSRSAVLATLFYLSTLILFFKGYPRKGTGSGMLYFSGALLCLVLGIFSKEIIVTLPALLFLYHYYFVSKESFAQWLARCWGWIALGAGMVAVFLIFKFGDSGLVMSGSEVIHPPSTYLLTQTFAIPFEYFPKMLFPFNLNIDVDFPVRTDWTLWSNYLGIFVLILLAVVCVVVSSINRFAGFGMAWAMITILPTSSFIPLLDMVVEHRTYLPLAGFSLVLAAGFCGLTSWLRQQTWPGGWNPVWVYRTVGFCGLLIPLFFSAALMKRNAAWKDEVSLWSDAKKKSPNLVRPLNNLGEAYDKLGRYEEAIREFKAALRLRPTYVFGLNNLGNIYGKQKKYAEAAEYFRKALAVKPSYAPANYNLAKALHVMGKAKEAVPYYRKAVQYNPYFAEARFNLAFLELQLGMVQEAVQDFLRFIELRSDYENAYLGLGNAYARSGKFEKALAAYRKAVALKPDFMLAQTNIGLVFLQTRRFNEAIAQYEKILELQPNTPGAHKNLGLIYTRHKKDPRKAIFHFEESLRLDPNQRQANLLRGSMKAMREDLRKEQGAGG